MKRKFFYIYTLNKTIILTGFYHKSCLYCTFVAKLQTTLIVCAKLRSEVCATNSRIVQVLPSHNFLCGLEERLDSEKSENLNETF